MSDEMLPPEGGQGGQDAPMSPQVPEPAVLQAPEPKRKLHWGFALLGFVTPWIAGALQGLLLNALSMVDTGIAAQMLIGLAGTINAALVVLMIVAWVVGRSQDKNGLRSFGIGGIASYAAVALVALLAFGACLFTL